MKNILSKTYFTLFFFFFASLLSYAQPSDTGDGSGGLEGNDAAPIDNYVWVLALVGLIFVFMKYRAYQKANATLK